MKRHVKKLFSTFLLAALTIGSMSISSMAATELKPESGDATLKVMSYLMSPQYISIPKAKFDITFTKDGVSNGQMLLEDTSQPDLINLKEQNGEFDYEKFDDSGQNVSGYQCYAMKSKNIIPAATAFTHAGEYVYTIKQSSNNNGDALNSYITYSKAEFKLHIFVTNQNDGSLRVSGIYANTTKKDDGTDGENAKAAIDDLTYNEYVAGQFGFVNYYKPQNQTLFIDNTVAGDLANKNSEFGFTVQLDNPSYSPSKEVNTYYGLVVDASTMKPVSEDIIEFKTGSESDEITIKNGQKLIFVKSDYEPDKDVAVTAEEQECLPGGLLYQSTFLSYTGFQPSAVVTHGGKTEKESKGTTGDPLNVISHCYVDVGSNCTQYTAHSYEAVITGINDNLIPFAFMVFLAALGFAVNLNSKRRSDR